MAKRGGYRIIDLQNKLITASTQTTIRGIYSALADFYNKPLLLSGANVDNVMYPDVWIDAILNGSNQYTFTAHNRTFTVTNDDKVSVSASK